MKLVKEQLESLNELKSDDIFIENKKHYQDMIKNVMKRFRLSKEIAVMMISRGIEKAASTMD